MGGVIYRYPLECFGHYCQHSANYTRERCGRIGKTRHLSPTRSPMHSEKSNPPGTPLAQPRGVLRPSFSEGQFEHHRQLPSASLAGLVEHYWHVRWDLRGLPAQQQATLPHPNVHLVVEQGQARIYGVHQGRFVRQLQGLDQVFGIKFKVGGFYPFYRQPVAQLLNESLDVGKCFGPNSADLAHQVSASFDFSAMCIAAEEFLVQHLPPPDPQVARVSSLLARIALDSTITSVENVLTISGLNKRGLQRLFQKYVGIHPKWVVQRYRLHEAIAQVQAGNVLNWAALALELGYFDQAHFARDFRQLVGMAPGQYENSLTH
jgi:AraC-like DNA-binding protein